MVIKRSPGGQACRWRAINFEIHLWSSGKNADCIFGDRSASSMSKWRPAWTLTPEMIHFRTKSVTLSMSIDLLTIVHVDRRRWRSHQLTYDLKRCLLFRKCLRFFESESSFDANVCHRRPGGSMATSHLVTNPVVEVAKNVHSQWELMWPKEKLPIKCDVCWKLCCPGFFQGHHLHLTTERFIFTGKGSSK